MDYSLINKKKILITGANSRFAKSLKQFLFGKNIFETNILFIFVRIKT